MQAQECLFLNSCSRAHTQLTGPSKKIEEGPGQVVFAFANFRVTMRSVHSHTYVSKGGHANLFLSATGKPADSLAHTAVVNPQSS